MVTTVPARVGEPPFGVSGNSDVSGELAELAAELDEQAGIAVRAALDEAGRGAVQRDDDNSHKGDV